MATVVPFHGVRYNPAMVGDLGAVVTPPYDVIDPRAQQDYYQKHPYNIIRLELGYQYPTDNAKNNRYLRAARDYRQWLKDGILIQEKTPAFYLYEEEFSFPPRTYRRTGFFGRVRLEPYAEGCIRPHEETLTKPKADRLALMSACLANFSPVFALYNDPSGELAAEFAAVKQTAPPTLEIGVNGARHRLWVLDDPTLHRRITSYLAERELFIADGHHRYETALNFYQKVGSRVPGAHSILMYLASTADPGLVILPTHRIVHSLPGLDLEKLKKGLAQDFEVQPMPLTDPGEAERLLTQQRQAGKISLIMGTPEPAAYLLTLKNSRRVEELVPGHSAAWCRLDVSVLQVLILQGLLGMESGSLARQENLRYTREAQEALASLQRGEAQLVFLLNPTRVAEVTAVAAAGDKMPQKSTYFYPKLLTGMIINDLTS